jgi:hypothetical protein
LGLAARDDFYFERGSGAAINEQFAQFALTTDRAFEGRDGAIIEGEDFVAFFNAGELGTGIGRNFGYDEVGHAIAAWITHDAQTDRKAGDSVFMDAEGLEGDGAGGRGFGFF